MSKVLLISDVHFGVYANDPRWMEMQLEYFRVFLKNACDEHGVETVYILGDLLDNRKTLSVILESALRELFMNDLGHLTFHHIVGNHDVRYKDTNKTHSLGFLEDLPNYNVYTDTTSHGDILLMPWLHKNTSFEDEMVKFVDQDFKYCFGHFELNGFYLNKNHKMTHAHQQDTMLGKNFQMVFTGHYHTRSSAIKLGTKIQYLGAPFQLTRIDVDDPKGFVILDTETSEYEFVESEGIFKFINLDYENDDTINNLERLDNSFLDVYIKKDSIATPEYDIFKKSLAKLNIIDMTTVTKVENVLEVKQEIVQENASVETSLPTYIDALKVDDDTRQGLNALMEEIKQDSQFTY